MLNGELHQPDKNLETLFELTGDTETALFLGEWLNNGRNATRAYLKLHPSVNYQSARTLGSRMLTKVDILDVFSAYGLGVETYLKQLKAGLRAKDGNGQPDNKTRRSYHQALGEALGIEGRSRETLQFNLSQIGYYAIGKTMTKREKERGVLAT